VPTIASLTDRDCRTARQARLSVRGCLKASQTRPVSEPVFRHSRMTSAGRRHLPGVPCAHKAVAFNPRPRPQPQEPQV
jgi:hypothetical protein